MQPSTARTPVITMVNVFFPRFFTFALRFRLLCFPVDHGIRRHGKREIYIPRTVFGRCKQRLRQMAFMRNHLCCKYAVSVHEGNIMISFLQRIFQITDGDDHLSGSLCNLDEELNGDVREGTRIDTRYLLNNAAVGIIVER